MSNSRKVVHVVPSQKGGWDVKQEGKAAPVSHHNLKDRAVDKARSEAKSADLGQVKVHGQNGRIQTEWTYGNDPKESKG